MEASNEFITREKPV